MILQEIVDCFRNGVLPSKEAYPALYESLQPLFQVHSILSECECGMTWTLGDKEGITANFNLQIPASTDRLSMKLYIDKTDVAQIPYNCLLTGKTLELDEFGIFFLLLKGGVLVDVGANIGWYSLLGALSGAAVYAFEPVGPTYQRLCRNIELNGLTTIKPFCIGLGEKFSSEVFYYHQLVSGASSRVNLDYLSDGMAQQITCTMDTLDNICEREKMEQINLIKCDVEGGELLVFRGGIQTLKKHRPYVLCEMLRKWSAKFNYYPDEIINLFAELDYICVALRKKQPGTGYILAHMLETTEETNFLFTPAEKIKDIESFLQIENKAAWTK